MAKLYPRAAARNQKVIQRFIIGTYFFTTFSFRCHHSHARYEISVWLQLVCSNIRICYYVQKQHLLFLLKYNLYKYTFLYMHTCTYKAIKILLSRYNNKHDYRGPKEIFYFQLDRIHNYVKLDIYIKYRSIVVQKMYHCPIVNPAIMLRYLIVNARMYCAERVC